MVKWLYWGFRFKPPRDSSRMANRNYSTCTGGVVLGSRLVASDLGHRSWADYGPPTSDPHGRKRRNSMMRIQRSERRVRIYDSKYPSASYSEQKTNILRSDHVGSFVPRDHSGP